MCLRYWYVTSDGIISVPYVATRFAINTS